jgi:hypothetical protein
MDCPVSQKMASGCFPVRYISAPDRLDQLDPSDSVNDHTNNGRKRLIVPKMKRRVGNPIRTPAMLALQRQKEQREEQEDEQNGRFRSPPEGFYVGAMLNATPMEYVKACHDFTARQALWKETCERMSLTPPTHSLAGQSFTRKQHFNDLAALVLEESIHTLSEAINTRWSDENRHVNRHSNSSAGRNQRTAKKDPSTMFMNLSERTFNSQSHVVFFEYTLPDQGAPFSREQLFHLRTGTMVECVPASLDFNRNEKDLSQVVLACICMTNRSVSAKTRSFIVMTVPLYDQFHLRCSLWAVTPLVSLVSEFRQLETCQLLRCGQIKMPFLHALLGQSPEHQAQQEPSREVLDLTQATNEKAAAAGEEEQSSSSTPSTPPRNSKKKPPQKSPTRCWRLPELNAIQSKAAAGFLDSPAGNISLVQGPPGRYSSTVLGTQPTCSIAWLTIHVDLLFAMAQELERLPF